MRVARVELHRRHKMGSGLFLQKLRGRICMSRNYFIVFMHRERWR
jgi:hypothetical protein